MSEPILGFFGTYRFLSNFHEHPEVTIWISDCHNGKIACSSIEHAFQASKTVDIVERIKVAAAPDPAASKREGRKVTLRSDWEQVKIDVMLELLTQKFSHPFYRELLIATGDAFLEETNSWQDRFWGVCNGVGENHLGKLLMQIREVLND
jgi:ribA/ribD-fused uncharacterized protein